MALSRHAARLITAMIALCGALALQRAEAFLPGDFAILLTRCAADESSDASAAGRQFAATPTVDLSDSMEAGSPGGIDPDPSDDAAAPAAGHRPHFRATSLRLSGGRFAVPASARCSPRSARGPPATA